MSPKPSKEYELVLMIVSQQPDSILKRVSELSSLAGYGLREGEVQHIHDLYLDTPDRSLSKHKLNLRIRRKNDRTFATLKQFPGKFALMRNARKEIELEWSTTTRSWIEKELLDRGVKLTRPAANHAADSPLNELKAIGLQVVQDRETLRKTKNIVSSEGRLLAELAIDTVTYHFREVGDLQLVELEIEAKSIDEGRVVVDQVTDWLAKLFQAEMRKWKSGKMRTGRFIETLAQNGSLRGLIEDGKLLPEAYDVIDRASGA